MKGFVATLAYLIITLIVVEIGALRSISRDSYTLGQNSYFGKKGPNDRLLYITRASRESRAFRNVSMEIQIPSGDQKTAGLITYIEALDMDKDGTGGYARLKEGGIGFKNVTLRLVSQKGREIDFMIRVYGQRCL